MGPVELRLGQGDDPRLRTELLDRLRPMLEPPPSMSAPRWSTGSIRDAAGGLAGGIIGLTTGLWLSIELLWVDERHRGLGLGRMLIAALEQEARGQACRGAWVETSSERARRFYEHLGYVAAMAREEAEPGFIRFTLQKRFTPHGPGRAA